MGSFLCKADVKEDLDNASQSRRLVVASFSAGADVSRFQTERLIVS